MKTAHIAIWVALMVFAGPAVSAPLGQKSKAPDWNHATQAEKDAWTAAYKFKTADIKLAEVVACLDSYSDKPVFADNDLTGLMEMCESIAALPH